MKNGSLKEITTLIYKEIGDLFYTSIQNSILQYFQIIYASLLVLFSSASIIKYREKPVIIKLDISNQLVC